MCHVRCWQSLSARCRCMHRVRKGQVCAQGRRFVPGVRPRNVRRGGGAGVVHSMRRRQVLPRRQRADEPFTLLELRTRTLCGAANGTGLWRVQCWYVRLWRPLVDIVLQALCRRVVPERPRRDCVHRMRRGPVRCWARCQHERTLRKLRQWPVLPEQWRSCMRGVCRRTLRKRR